MGFFLDILYIGIKLAITAMATLIIIIIAICLMPKNNTVNPTCVIFMIITFNPIQTNIVAKIDNTAFIIAIIKLSLTNMF